MAEILVQKKIPIPNLLLIAGNGRNVGKTTLACQIISHLSPNQEITGIKISSHLHQFQGEALFFEENKYVILEEKEHSSKDSSRMLQAGAARVFFIMAKPESLEKAFNQLLPMLNSEVIICESGGLHEHVQPGLFLFVNERERNITKTEHLEHQPRLVQNDGKNFDIEIQNIHFKEQRIALNE